MQVLLRKTLSGLSPEGEEATEYLKKIPAGTLVVGDLKDSQKRSTQQNALFFAMLTKICENQSYYANTDQLRFALLVRLGYCDRIKMKNGEVIPMPQSMAFSKMSQADFSSFMDKAINFICEEVLPGLDHKQLVRELRDLLNDPPALRDL